MDNAGATSIDSSWTMMEARSRRSDLARRSPWPRKSAYTWASQKTARVARVASRMSSADSCPPAVVAITALATIVP
jgi:hypothetical protein